MLSTQLDNEIIEIIGLTHKGIYILQKNKTNNLLFDNSVQPIFGLAGFTSNCAVNTDAFLSLDKSERDYCNDCRKKLKK